MISQITQMDTYGKLRDTLFLIAINTPMNSLVHLWFF